MILLKNWQELNQNQGPIALLKAGQPENPFASVRPVICPNRFERRPFGLCTLGQRIAHGLLMSSLQVGAAITSRASEKKKTPKILVLAPRVSSPSRGGARAKT